MPENLSPQQLLYLAILVAAFALLITERLRNDLVALLIVLALATTGILSPSEALAGFASEPAIVVAAIFVLSGALHQTGLSAVLGAWIGRLAGASLTRALAVIMPSVALLSAFTHHLTTAAVLLPVTLSLSRERDLPASRLLIPLSMAASLGTTITIIGAPAFLIASAVLQQAGRPGLGIFSIAPIGLALSLAGTLFMLVAGRFLLPDRRGSESAADHFRLDGYLTEVAVLEKSPLVGKTVEQVRTDPGYDLRPVGVIREGSRVQQTGSVRLETGDVLLVQASPDQVATIRQEHHLELEPVKQYQTEPGSGTNGQEAAEQLVQALGRSPEPYVVTVAMAAAASFLTPIGHHGNLLVYGPGGYRFSDFVRVGAPLTALVALVVVLLAPRLWPG